MTWLALLPLLCLSPMAGATADPNKVLRVAFEVAVMEIACGGNEYPGVDVQLPAAVQFDLDKATAHIALTLAPGADPVRCLR